MGHRLSKSNSTASAVSSTTAASITTHRHSNDSLRLRNEQNLNSNPAGPPSSHSTSIDIRTTSVPATSTAATTTTTNQNLHIESTTVTVPAQAAARRFVIKIQLTKMEAGSSPDDAATTMLSTSVALDDGDNGNGADNLDNNLNVTRPILNLTFTKNIQCDSNDQIVIESNEEIKLNNLSAISDRRVGGCIVNSNFISNFSPNQLIDDEGNELQSNNNRFSIREGNLSRETPCNSGGSSHCGEAVLDVPENVNQHQRIQGCSSTGAAGTVCACAPEGDKDHCCRRKKSTAYPSKWRCCKCICRTSAAGNSKDSAHADDAASSSASSTSSKCSSKTSWTSKLNCTRAENPATDNSADLAMWMPPENSAFLSLAPAGRHLVPLSDVLLLTLNCPPSLVVGQIEDCDERARRLRALEIETGFDPMSELGSAFANALSGQKRCDHVLCSLCSPSFRHVVHSQVDYIHCLVPDLDKITNSSFYWGKMDRYEAERLLEGKPEGTFLLRDSAQEEYLFSVTFRKYGRSLHARIEQFNHKFSFDCHDPGVFTARTVTGLLEHYKDPSCVMFFEPMLTIPLHRNFTFSLQQLCRASIVSHATYDGINELHLPNSLKSYLKEYHYKLRVRVKPFDDFYHCS